MRPQDLSGARSRPAGPATRTQGAPADAGPQSQLRRIWGWPLLLGCLAAGGLLLALLGDGPWDLLGAALLAAAPAAALPGLLGWR